jgi:hypothetical protein
MAPGRQPRTVVPCMLLRLTAGAWFSEASVARVRIEWHHERGMTRTEIEIGVLFTLEGPAVIFFWNTVQIYTRTRVNAYSYKHIHTSYLYENSNALYSFTNTIIRSKIDERCHGFLEIWKMHIYMGASFGACNKSKGQKQQHAAIELSVGSLNEAKWWSKYALVGASFCWQQAKVAVVGN